MNEIKEYTEKMFEDIKHIDENGSEYWSARELQKALEYKDWRNFNKVVEKEIIDIDKLKLCVEIINNYYHGLINSNNIINI